MNVLASFFDRESLTPDLARGVRCMVSFMAPLLLAIAGHLPVEMIFAAIAAQSVANVDVRGRYLLRFLLLLSMTLVISAAGGLGALTGHPLGLALAATALVAAGTGLWRHLSSDYGPSLATSSSLVFYIALSEAGGAVAALHHVEAALLGGFWGTLLQVAVWPIRPQHPLRAAVGDSWLAAARLFDDPAPNRAAEAQFRSTIEKGHEALAAALKPGRAVPARLEELNRVAARLVLRVSAFQTAYEPIATDPSLAPAVAAIFTVLANTARSVALAVVSRQPAHLATADVRLQRLKHLTAVLRARMAALPRTAPDIHEAVGSVIPVLALLEDYLPAVALALRATMDRADERAAFSLELVDLQSVTLRPLAAALNFSRRVDRALLLYTLRIAVLTVAGVWLMKTVHWRHGYWVPFTMVVVLQPDYGSTRLKAMQRLAGTIVGSVAASALLALALPFAVLMAATALTSFVFGYYLKRNYGLAVVFITLFVVVLTESLGPATLALTAERVADTLGGGVLALLAALLFWPVWERDHFRPILSRALRANAAYLRVIGRHLFGGEGSANEVTLDRRKAESANASVFSSLQRMAGDPANRRDRIETIAVIANGNQRITRSLNLIALQWPAGTAAKSAGEAAQRMAAALDRLADVNEGKAALPAIAADRETFQSSELPEASSAPPGSPRAVAMLQLGRAGAELSAILIAGEELANAPASVS